MRKRSIVLLSLTTIFNLLFWLMLVNHYSLRVNLDSFKTTAVIGSTAIVILSVLIVREQRRTAPPPIRIRPFRGTQTLIVALEAIFLLLADFLLLVSVLLVVGFSLYCLLLPLSSVQQTVMTIVSSFGMLLLVAIALSCFDWANTLRRQAALPKPTTLLGDTLQWSSLLVILVFLLSIQDLAIEDDLLCSRRYLSPSGQRSIVIEDHEVADEIHYSFAYFEGTLFRRHLGDTDRSVSCKQHGGLKLQWSADERKVDWTTPGKQGRWQF